MQERGCYDDERGDGTQAVEMTEVERKRDESEERVKHDLDSINVRQHAKQFNSKVSVQTHTHTHTCTD